MTETYTSGVWIAKAGEETQFEAAWEEFPRWARGRDECGTLRLVRDVEAPSRYMSFAPWTSFEAQRAWKEDPEFRERMAKVRQHVEDFSPSTYELVTTIA